MRVVLHTVKDGERWDSIAYRYYGDALKIAPLINANRHLSLCESLPAGSVVLVPVVQKAKNQNDLPPWLKNQE